MHLNGMPAVRKSPNVAVIGAGFSGLSCANVLKQSGANVTIFEARDRVGGRAAQTKIGQHVIDLGPNWIHGPSDNPIMVIAEETKSILQDFESGQVVFSKDGKLLDEKMTDKLSDFVWTSIHEAFLYSNKHKDAIPPDRSLFDFLLEKIEGTDFSGAEKDACVEACKLWGAYVGDPVDRQSLRFFYLEECVDETNIFVASGYKRILDYVSKSALQHGYIRFNQPVVKIESATRDPSARHQITLTTATGERAQFDEVVVTCPLGWLKRNKSVFSPDLPPRLTQAIDNISYSRLEKIYVTFPRAFWHTPPATHANGPISPAANYGFPVFAQFFDPTYIPHSEGRHWNQELLSLAALPPSCAHPTLLFYTYGPCATYIVTKLASLAPEEHHSFLDAVVHPFYSRLSGYTPDCKPLAIVATQWQNDPYAGNGAYSNFQVGLEHGDRDIEVMREGVGAERGVWFAGEHTAPFAALGTTTGAFWSGERAAGQICELYGLEKCGMGAGRDDSLPSGRKL